MRTFKLAVLVSMSLAAGVADLGAGVRGGGHGGGHGGGQPASPAAGVGGLSYSQPAPAVAASPTGGGRHHGGGPGGGFGGGHRPATTYHYDAWDSGAGARSAPQSEYRSAPQYTPPVAINIEPVSFRREYTQRQAARYWRWYFSGGHRYSACWRGHRFHRFAKRCAMPLGTTAKIIQIKDIDRTATPLRRKATAAPRPARYSVRYAPFVQLSSR
jgi:hypothetical protein